MRRANRNTRIALLAAVVVGTGGVVAVLAAVHALRSLELNTVDQRFAIRGPRRPRGDVVLVALDSRAIAALGRPPLPRSFHAQVIDRLHQAGAGVIAYDLRFQGKTSPAQDNALIRAVSQARPVVLATEDPGGSPLPVPADVRDPGRTGAVLASIAVPNDSDGKIRKLLYAPIRLKSFPVRTAELALGHPVAESNFPANVAWVDYPGGPGTVPTYSLVDVLQGRVAPSAFHNRIVVVGPTDPIEKDVFLTPVSDVPMSGPEIQADSIATVLDGFPLRRSSGLVDALLVALMVLVAPLLALRRSPRVVLPGALLALGMFLVAAQLAFNTGRIITVVYPVLALLMAAAAAVTVHYGLEATERRRLRLLFARFVPPEVVDDVISRVDEDLRLGGVRREGTVMFCDLRGFTSFSESLAPEDVVRVVNRYLEEMSDAILEHGGTLVSFAGDGIMALFGAPIEQPDHADRAVAAAQEMIELRLARFNAWCVSMYGRTPSAWASVSTAVR